MEVTNGIESAEKEVEWETMTEDEFNKQRNRFCRLVSLNDQVYIGQLNYEINEFERMWRYSQQRQKRLEEKLSESYAENRNLRDRLYTGVKTTRPQTDCQLKSKEYAHPNITRLRNTNVSGESLENIFAFLNQNSNGINSTKQAAESPQSDVGQLSMDPLPHQVVREHVLRAIFD